MHPDNLDDLFRGKLDGHETPPGADLWARLLAQPAAEPATSAPTPAPAPNAERLDQLFQSRLAAHISPPARELWERLEDEHLRPRKRRAAAWWPMAIAAAIALLITAGGAGLWLGFPGGKTSSDAVAVQSGKGTSVAAGSVAPAKSVARTNNKNKVAAGTTPLATETQVAVAANTPAGAVENTVSAPIQKKAAPQATHSLTVASTVPKARKFAERQSPRYPMGSTRQPDVAAPSPLLVARTTPAVAPTPAPVVAQTATPIPASEIDPTGSVITVDVRNGATPAVSNIRAALAEATATDEAAEHRGLGGRLLQQAGHLVRGERLSIAEATGLPENVTLRATIGGRRVSKSIQL